MSEKSASLDAGPSPVPHVDPALVLKRMVSFCKNREQVFVMLDRDLLAVAEYHGISRENKNLSNDLNMAWMKSMMDRGYLQKP